MSHSPFARAFITATCVAGAVFTASAFPLAFSKAKVVDVELQKQPVFSSEMRDLAAPYLALSASLSVAIGFGVFGMLGWQTANKKLSKVANESSNLARDLAIHQAELERIKFSEARLQGQNLTAFLQPSPDTPLVGQAFYAASTIGVTDVPHTPQTASGLILNQPASTAVHQPVVPAEVPLPAQVQTIPKQSEPKSEVLNSLLQQLNQLSQQVEELQSSQTKGMAA
jgi:hypothetical protein